VAVKPAAAPHHLRAPVDMLTLSGGGAECAYGAGFLAGWSDSGSRPRSAPRPRWQPYRVGQSNQL
jgi:hypothetical protein